MKNKKWAKTLALITCFLMITGCSLGGGSKTESNTVGGSMTLPEISGASNGLETKQPNSNDTPLSNASNSTSVSTDEKTILLVDDSETIRSLIKEFLTENGYVVVGEAENGVEAVNKYKAHSPMLVIMNIDMPEMDGIQATREIKALDDNAKIIMCNSLDFDMEEEAQELVVESIQAGAIDFIVKPFTEEIFIEKVKNAIG